MLHDKTVNELESLANSNVKKFVSRIKRMKLEVKNVADIQEYSHGAFRVAYKRLTLAKNGEFMAMVFVPKNFNFA